MNRAVDFPEERLYKGNDLFDWGDSPGLEHHCGVCAKPLNNPKAKSTCIGCHVEPCRGYHQQLHFKGKSHECFGCATSNEQHYKRHKEIFVIAEQIRAMDVEANDTISSNRKLTSEGKSLDDRASDATSTDASSEFDDDRDGTKMSRRARKKAERAGGVKRPPNPRIALEIYTLKDIDDVSEAIHQSKCDGKGAWKESFVETFTALSPTSELRSLNSIECNVAEDDAMSPTSVTPNMCGVKKPLWPTPRQQRAAKASKKPHPHPFISSKNRGHTQKFKIATMTDSDDVVDPNIFERLGIKLDPPNSTKARKKLFNDLSSAIKNDLDVVCTEAQESRIREEGFWRWAGKGVYLKMLALREEYDWETGQRKDKRSLTSISTILDLNNPIANNETGKDGSASTTCNTKGELLSTTNDGKPGKTIAIRAAGVKRALTVKNVNTRRMSERSESKEGLSTVNTYDKCLEVTEAPHHSRPTAGNASFKSKTYSSSLKITIPSPIIEQVEDGWTTVAPKKGSRAVK